MNNYNYNNEISKITIQQINKKIYGYKQQDNIKKFYNSDKFITLESIINKIIECNLKRRRRSDDKFLFTKQLNLIKIDEEKIDSKEN